MIIVSQDKTDIINFDNIGWLYVEPNDNKIYVAFEDGTIVIAEYKTEERAKEVLQEIIDNYKFNHCEAIGQKHSVYKMPKE